MRSKELIEQFTSFAATAENLNEVATAFETCSRALDIRYFLYLASDVPFQHAAPPFVMTNADQEWRSQYLETAEYLNDPVVRAAMTNVLAFEWPTRPDPASLSKNEVEFLQNASEYGLRYSAAVPLHGPGPARAALCLMTDSTTKKSLDGCELITLQILGLSLHDTARRLRYDEQNGSDSSHLTDREIQCLAWAARGKTSWETAMILEVTETTINFHLTNAMKKLGVVTRPHAVATAVAMGLINA